MSTSESWSYQHALTKRVTSWYTNVYGTSDLASFLAPDVQVDAPQGQHKVYDNMSAFTLQNTKLAAYKAPRLVDMQGVDHPYSLEDHGLDAAIEEKIIRAGGQAYEKLKMLKTTDLVNKMRQAQIARVLEAVRKDTTAVAKTYARTTGKPIADLIEACYAFELENGVKPNRLLISTKAWNIIQDTDDMKVELANNRTRRMTPELIREILGGEGFASMQIRKDVLPYNKSKNATSNADLLDSELLLFYSADDAHKDDQSAMRNLCLAGSDYVSAVKMIPDPLNRCERYRVESYCQTVISAPSAIKRWTVST